nr:hypothetical protein [Tanacetum cinerariifolium]
MSENNSGKLKDVGTNENHKTQDVPYMDSPRSCKGSVASCWCGLLDGERNDIQVNMDADDVRYMQKYNFIPPLEAYKYLFADLKKEKTFGSWLTLSRKAILRIHVVGYCVEDVYSGGWLGVTYFRTIRVSRMNPLYI